MIFITGDLHIYDGHNYDQRKSGKEVMVALKYLEILKKYKMPCTLFINGICFKKESEHVKKILDYDVELGGHTYNNFGLRNLFHLNKTKGYIYRRIWRCVYGPASFQKKDIKKTKRAFENFGLKMTSWRTHAFSSNERTFKILKDEGVKYVSDLLGNQKPFYKEVIHLPINIPVDQNTIAYGINRPENKDPFAPCIVGRIQPEEWFEIIKKRVIENEKNKIPSVMLIHPTTMDVLDNFRLFEKIIKFLSKYKAYKISEFELKK